MSFGEDVAALVAEANDPLLATADRWERVPLGSVADVLNGFPWKSDRFGTAEGVPLIRIRDVTTGATETRYDGPITEGYWVEDGDLLVGMDGDFNVRRWKAERGLLNQRVCKITTEPEHYSTSLLEYVLPGYLQLVNRMTSSVTVKHLSSRTLSELPLPLPPAAEQHRIVAKLDALTVRLTRARAELDRVPLLAAKLRANALDQAFRGQFACEDGVQHRPCADWIDSTFYGPRFGKDEYVPDGVPTARTTDFESDGTMNLDGAPQVKCSEADFAKWGLVEGDLLVTRTGSIGKCAVYTSDQGRVLPSAYLIRVRFTPSILPRFAWMMFASPQGQAHLGVNARAVTQPNINANAIRSLPFPMLTRQQQATTVAAVDQRFAHANRLEAEANRARALIDRLEAAILARAFLGELVPQDPADEPASVLLNRIRAQRAAAPKPKRGRRK